MKLKFKMIAIAAALASLAGGAQADINTTSTNNGTLVLTVFNQSTKAWYMRDLGFTINTFLPSGVLASVGDPSSLLVGDKTPNAGLVLDASNTANFGDANWGTWFAGQVANDLRWNVTAVDTNQGTGNGVRRMLVSSANIGETSTNGQIDNFINTSNAGSASAFFNPAGLSNSDPNGVNSPYQTSLDSNFGLGADGLATIGQDVRLFYFAKTTGTSGSLVPAVTFGNTTGAALISLAANGNFSYTLAGEPVSEVPLPAAAWLMGAGLMAIGGMVRRRTAASQA